MKISVVMAVLLSGLIAATGAAVADIEDNLITIENYGHTDAEGYKKKKRFGPFSKTKDHRGSNAGGVIIRCPVGSACNRNRISIRNTGHIKSHKGATVGGVTLNER